MNLKAEADYLAKDILVGSDWKAILDLANAADDFQPLFKRGVWAEIVRTRLVRLGIAEAGGCSVAGAVQDHEEGYRLSALGWALFDRGNPPAPIRPKRIGGAFDRQKFS